MRKFILTAAALFVMAVTAFAEGRAKYVFYFIGDGMGVNQVNGTETYLAAVEGFIGTVPLQFAQFPYTGFVTTFSGTNGVTDSAAAGTALATGNKTKNGVIGMLADQNTAVNSVAVWAKEAGAAVGVGTSVTVNHATPASFYAHRPDRNMYYEIGKDLITAGFDFYAGSDFASPENKNDATATGSLYDQCAAAGYTIARGYKDFRKKLKNADRIILFQQEKDNAGDHSSLAYAIDRSGSDMTLQEVTRAGISALTKQNKDGFFLMIEGGKIDYACHANDAAAAFRETQDFDRAISVAYEFYEQHPDETLIVVTADHETGGIVLGRGKYELHTDLLKYQKMSAERYSKHLEQLYKKYGKKLTWEQVEKDLKANWGFWDKVELTDHQTDRLKKAYRNLTEGHDQESKNLYATLNGISDAARRTMAEAAMVGWQSGGHSNGYVPVFAIGAGAEAFTGRIDNTTIAGKIAVAAGWDKK